MAAKPEASAASAAKDAVAVAAPAAAGAPAGPAPARGALSAWLPVIAAILLSPVATWATVEYVLLPQMQKKLAAPLPADAEKSAAATEAEGGKGHSGKAGASPGYEFSSVVVNLSGTMGTRYLKTTFLVTGPDADIKGVFEAAKPRLTDITLNVLSSLTLADLEEPGSKNVIRERLVTAYNQALGRKVAEQVYFSDFVIQ
jgi:flagellar protein FliL